MVTYLEEDGIVGRVHKRNIAYRDVPAIDENEGVRAAHPFLAGRIEDFVAVDYALSGNRYIFQPVAEYQRSVPLAPFGFRHEIGDLGMLVLIEVRSSDERGAGFEKECYVALEMHCSGEVSAGRQHDLAASGRGAGLDGFVYGGRIERRAVAHSAKVADIEHAGSPGDRRLGNGHED